MRGTGLRKLGRLLDRQQREPFRSQRALGRSKKVRPSRLRDVLCPPCNSCYLLPGRAVRTVEMRLRSTTDYAGTRTQCPQGSFSCPLLVTTRGIVGGKNGEIQRLSSPADHGHYIVVHAPLHQPSCAYCTLRVRSCVLEIVERGAGIPPALAQSVLQDVCLVEAVWGGRRCSGIHYCLTINGSAVRGQSKDRHEVEQGLDLRRSAH